MRVILKYQRNVKTLEDYAMIFGGSRQFLPISAHCARCDSSIFSWGRKEVVQCHNQTKLLGKATMRIFEGGGVAVVTNNSLMMVCQTHGLYR